MKMFSRGRNRKKKDVNNSSHGSEANRDMLNNSKLHHPEILAMGEMPPPSNAAALNQQNDAISKYILALAEKHKGGKKEPQTWRTFLHNFAKNSTFHGVRHVFDNSSFVARRILWGLLILISMGFLLNQVIDRILYFSKNPVTVKVEVNFNKTLRFPAVLLCNQNSFKITEAVRLGYKSMLDKLYSVDEARRPEVLEKHNFSHVRLDDMLLSTAHKKEDMIVSCSWNDKKCGHENFTQVLTDHGVCYVFNGRGQKTLFVSESDVAEDSLVPIGASSALRVVLNVEQYENMIGPYDGAGVKILLYDRRDIPSIEDHGQGIATGTHTYVGTQVVMMKRLPPPQGNCTESSQKLDYFAYYSEHACDVICWSKYYAKQCNCILPHMPKIPGYPNCTLEYYFKCGVTAKKSFNKDRECNCKSSCDSVIYQPNFSYLSTSTFDIEKIFKFVDTEELLRRFIAARDSSSATESDIFDVDKRLMMKLSNTSDKISHLLQKEIPNNLNSTANEMEAVRSSLSAIYGKIFYSYDFQHYHVRKNFYRYVEAQNERVWSDVSLSYGTFFFKLQRSGETLLNMEDNEENSAKRFAVYNQAMGEVEAKRHMASYSLKVARRCYLSYSRGSPVFHYPYQGDLNKTLQNMIVPRALLKTALNKWGSGEDDPIKDFSDNLAKLIGIYDQWETLLNNLYNNTSNDTKMELFMQLRRLWKGFSTSMKAHNGLRSHLLDDVYIYPVQEMEKRLENLKNVYSRLNDVLISTKQHVETMHKSLERIKGDVWGNISAVLAKTRAYCANKTLGKTALAKIISSSVTRDNTKFIKAFFEDTGSRCRQIYDNWQKLSTLEVDLFKLVRSDSDMETFRNFYLPELSGNTTYSAIGSRVKEAMANVHKFRQLAESGDYEFQESFRVIWQHLSNYLARNEINAQFYEENFLTMDIFFRELSYEMIEQQEAYNLIALLSDIGGSMGLFVGASILSVFEIFDVFTFSFIFKKKKTKKKSHIGTPSGVAV